MGHNYFTDSYTLRISKNEYIIYMLIWCFSLISILKLNYIKNNIEQIKKANKNFIDK